MVASRLVPVFLALGVLAAHFYRARSFALLAVTVALIALLVVRRPWAARSLQVGLLLGAVEWLRTLAALVAEREGAGVPYTRLALILGAVAAVTAACALLIRSAAMRRYFKMELDAGANASSNG